jgi:pimeloyl-ACP methyl ester carboxylesterase
MEFCSIAPNGAKLEARFAPNAGKATLVYLPGIHGDWTLFASFRQLAAPSFQLFEVTYPRANWGLNDYSSALESELLNAGLSRVWLLAESFSSQVAWDLARRCAGADSPLKIEGIILAGGFIRYPSAWRLSLAASLFRFAPALCWNLLFWIYGRYAIFRHRNAPETRAAVAEFIRRRTPEDLAAIEQRIKLVATNDPSATVRTVGCPVFLLAGGIDPIVPVRHVLKWLQQHCPSFAGHKVIRRADHNVLGTAPRQSLEQIISWINP